MATTRSEHSTNASLVSYTVTTALISALNRLRKNRSVTIREGTNGHSKRGAVDFPNATAPWVRLPSGSDLVARERGNYLVVDLVPTNGRSPAISDRQAVEQALKICV